MKQISVRLDDDLHRKLKERAEIEKRSVTSVVAEAIEDLVRTNERALVRAKLREAGLLDESLPAPAHPVDVDAAIESTRGWGTAVSEALAAERNAW